MQYKLQYPFRIESVDFIIGFCNFNNNVFYIVGFKMDHITFYKSYSITVETS